MDIFNRKHKKTEQSSPPVQHRAGFDNPLSNPDDDRLDRKRFINQIYPYLTSLESGWSVRVGLLATWGEGKTTLCRWVAQQAVKDGHIPVWFSPWTARTDAELWAGFYTALDKALKESNINISGFKTRFGALKSRFASLTSNGLTENISRLHQTGESGLKVIQFLTKMSPGDVKTLKNSIQGKRFIVILDDLDRVYPSLIPRLLMTLYSGPRI